MKVLKYLVFTVLISLFAVSFVSAESISIKSIDLAEKSDTTIVNNEPTFSGLEMNYDLTFKNVNDFAKYRIVIENNTDKEYKVTENAAFKASEYVTYFYSSDQIINANATTDVMITIKYYKQIDESLIPEEGETYKETNTAVLELKDENDKVVSNPKTGIEKPLIWLVTLLVVSSIGVFLIKKKEVSLAILVCLLIIPCSIKAIEELKLIINVNVEIQKPDSVVTLEPKYKVSYYLQNIDGIFTDEELSKFEDSEYECDMTYYLGEEPNVVKYNHCYGNFIINDVEEYVRGQHVSLKVIKMSLLPSDCYINREEEQHCSISVYNYRPFDTWEYSLNSSTEHQSTDKDLMQFSNISLDAWDSIGSITVSTSDSSPTTFIMPAHNIIFEIGHLK